MYGCFNAYLVYGWKEGNVNNQIDDKWLNENEIEGYSTDIKRLHAGEFVYGISCGVNPTGPPAIDTAEMEKVQKAYAKVVQHDKKKRKETCPLGYYLAVRGEYSSEHGTYFPGKHNTGKPASYKPRHGFPEATLGYPRD